MKCPNCGGNIPMESLSCPYCGTANQERIDFLEEIQRKIERNKLLKPFLLKQKTPELVQKMLTRIFLILLGVNVLIFVATFGFFMWGERDGSRRVPQEGSMAQEYYDTFIETEHYYFAIFLREAGDMIEMTESGEVPEEDDIEDLIRYGYEAVEAAQEEETPVREEIRLTVDAFFMGYLGLSEAEMQVFLPGEDGNYDYSVDSELLQKTTEIIMDKLQEVVK